MKVKNLEELALIIKNEINYHKQILREPKLHLGWATQAQAKLDELNYLLGWIEGR